MKRTVLIVLLSVVALALIVAAVFVWIRFWEIDACQDHGGAWIKGRCEY